jgi:hypothetical protein
MAGSGAQTPEGHADGMGKVGGPHGRRRHGVDRTGIARVVEGADDDLHQIVEVNPRHELPAVARHAAEAQSEGRRHQRQRAAIARQYDTRAQRDHAA